MLDLVQTQHAIGPAPVVRIHADEITVHLAGEPRRVTMAMPIRYRPLVGDLLLIASSSDTCYAIGVLSGSGAVELASAGDVTLRAGGSVRMIGTEGLTAEAPQMKLEAGRLELVARDLLTTAQSVLQRIVGLFHLSAGRRHTQITDSSVEHARQVVITAQDTVTVDGSTIHLG